MDSKMSTNKASMPPRRSTRSQEKVAGKALSFEPTPRGPLKRTRIKVDQPSAAVVNGSRDVENGLDDEEYPSKKSRLDTAGADGDGNSDSDHEMDVKESAEELEKNEDQEMETVEESSKDSNLPKTCKDALGATRLNPRVVLGQRCPVISSFSENQDCPKPKTAAKANVSPVKPAMRLKPTEIKHDVLKHSMADYQRTMEAKAKTADKPRVNHIGRSMFQASENTYTIQQHINSIPIKRETVPRRPEGTGKTVTTKRRSVNSCRGFMWYLWRLVFLVLLSSATMLAYKIIPVLQRTGGSGGRPSREVKPEKFAEQLSLLETQFPRQQSELWKRSKIHLEKHLKTEKPTEPVSLIFTAGLRAERTLHCLAQSLASTFSSALNASFLHIDGASKASEDSDKVKLDIDNQLQAAFEGDKPVAIIHRFEELPPGSTLIFYRYCDHENAAYKKVFLLFTLLLPQDEISNQLSLKEVEEMVQEHAMKKLVGAEGEAAFNKMDIDKFGGLWSRISHLILPVVSEVEIEQGGCPHNKLASQK